MGAGQRRTEMYYAEPVYRPPSEADSLLLQVTVGCSSAAAGRCHFCNSTLFHQEIPGKLFRLRPTDQVLEDIEIARELYGSGVRKIFLLDSNAMIVRTTDLLTILAKCYTEFPNLRQISCYGCCEDILRKSHQELQALRKAGLNLVFVGLESGDQEVLDLVNKGVSVQQQIDAVTKANAAGMQTSVSVILGLGGRRLSEQHAINTGLAVSAMNPSYLAALTLMLVPGTILHGMAAQGAFEPVVKQHELLHELKLMIENTHVPGPVIFRTNHASNYLQLRGILPQDQKNLLDTVHHGIKHPGTLREESMRGL